MSRESKKGAAVVMAELPSRRNGFHAARDERSRVRLDLGRSLAMHRGLALVVVIFGVLLAAAYLFLHWPMYAAEALVYIEPAPAAAGNAATAVQWPYNYDPATYESYIQQQMVSMTRQDVLKAAVDKLQNFQEGGESDQDAAARLARSIEVARQGISYEVSIKAHAASAQRSADIANAVASSYIASTLNEQSAGDAERLTVLHEETDRLKKQLEEDRAEQAALATAGAAQKPQRASDLAAEITRLQGRFDALNEELQNLLIEDAAPGKAHIAVAAFAPAHLAVSGVVRNTAVLLTAFVLLAILMAAAAHKIDSRLYVAADVERAIGFAPVVLLPDTFDVSKQVFEEQLLRLAAAIEQILKQGQLKSCVFTGADSGVGVTTIARRVRALLEGMNQPAVLVDATGKKPMVWPVTEETDTEEQRGTRPLVLIQRLTERARTHNGTVVLADAAPLAVSAETEYLARNTDCVILVLESGVTKREELRVAASVLQRLDVGMAGIVLNRVRLAKAGSAFRNAMNAAEAHVRLRKRMMKDETVRTRKVVAEPASVREPGKEPEARAVSSEEPKAAAEVPASTPAVETVTTAATAAAAPDEELMTQPSPPRRTSEAGEVPDLSAAAEGPTAYPEPPPAPPPISHPPEPGPALPWWLADSVLNPNAQNLPREPIAPAEPALGSQESRLGALRNLLTPQSAGPAGGLARPAPVKRLTPAPRPAPRADVPKESEARERGRGRAFVPVPEPVEPDESQAGEATKAVPAEARRKTPEVTAVPEFLPPRQTGDVAHEEDAASRRERRDTWDDVEVLPSWRGQYRRKE